MSTAATDVPHAMQQLARGAAAVVHGDLDSAGSALASLKAASAALEAAARQTAANAPAPPQGRFKASTAVKPDGLMRGLSK